MMWILRIIRSNVERLLFSVRARRVRAAIADRLDSVPVIELEDGRIVNLPCFYMNVSIEWEVGENPQEITAVLSDCSYDSSRKKVCTFELKRKPVQERKNLSERHSGEEVRQNILICVPHCDDEFFLAGGIIKKELNRQNNVLIVFCCNNDNRGTSAFEGRHLRALQALEVLGVPRENVYCLGYSNGHYMDKEESIYFARNGHIIQNKEHISTTYGTKWIQDFHTAAHGSPAAFTYENMRDDLTEFIMKIRPDVIYAVDLDQHIDHALCSLLVETAIGRAVKTLEQYTPKVYKGFAYAMSAYGTRDLYRGKTVKATRRTWRYWFELARRGYGLDNPRYRWKDRIKVINPTECQVPDMKENVLIRGFLKYKLMYSSIASFINKDSVFWERYTDNLALKATVHVSDGEPDSLNDFKLLDMSDLKKREFDQKCWSPGDPSKKCTFQWAERKRIAVIKIYQNMNFLHGIKKVKIEAEDFSTERRLKGGRLGDEIAIGNPVMTSWLSISIVSTSSRFGIDEIEVFQNRKTKQHAKNREPMIYP